VQCLAWKRLTTGIVLLVFDEYFLLIRLDQAEAQIGSKRFELVRCIAKICKNTLVIFGASLVLGQTHGLDVQHAAETNLGSSPSFVGLKLSRTRFKSHSDHSTWSKDPTALHMEVVRDGRWKNC